MNGVHKVAPHPPGDKPDSPLPMITTNPTKVTFASDAPVRTAAHGQVLHKGDGHMDTYSVDEQLLFNQQEVGQPPVWVGKLISEYKIKADHVTPPPPPTRSVPAGKGVGAKKDGRSGSQVSFIADGAGGGRLHFATGALDILDTVGGQSGGIDPRYSNDPVLNSNLVVGDMPLIGRDPDGAFRFGGAQVSLTDPNGELSFAGQLGDFVLRDTTQTNPVDSFALFDQLAITTPALSARGASLFLNEFIDTNMFGAGLSPAEEAGLVGIDFTFNTLANLADLTDNFTTSALDVPATQWIMLNVLPEPSAVLLLAVGALGAGALRRTSC
jgi:hypothetical protein